MILSMPKIEKPGPAHRNTSSISTASAAGASGTRSSSWSTKDDETLIQARAQGLNWNQIAPKHFPSKSPNACRKRHERLMERQNAEQWDGVKLNELAEAYMDVRREMWSLLASRVGEKWQLVELKCMEKGLKNLNQAYRSAQKKQGTCGHDDSGVGISDLDEDERSTPLEPVDPTSFSHYHTYPTQQQRVPSIQSILQQQPAISYAGHPHHFQHPQL